MFKRLIIILTSLVLFSCSVEQSIKEHSYTEYEWYYIDTLRFQVYKTLDGRRYIVVLNENHTRYKRQYITKENIKIERPK